MTAPTEATGMTTSSDAVKAAGSSVQQESKKYTMRISRLTVDKLGIQMYDRVAAVLAELIANSYDADAEQVEIHLPFGQYLARKTQGQIIDQGFKIVISDDGCGMTTDEINEYYLNVGYNRRTTRNERTPKHNRRVMGRKGIGKLAPFGICHIVEVISAGGERTDQGYSVSNLILDLDDIVNEKTDENGNVLPYHPQPGPLDGTFSDESGTKLILRVFDRRRVPQREDLSRQTAARFGLRQENWRVQLLDSDGDEPPFYIGDLDVDLMENTRITVDDRPIQMEDGFLPVSGWVAYAKDPYKDETMAGVRLFARGKIVAQTRDFDIKSGFTGEFKMRSYLTGEIHAEWLDEEEDCIRTDRQDIIWNSELGVPLREWGRDLLKELASRAAQSAQRRVWDIFIDKSRLKDRLERALPGEPAVRSSVMKAAQSIVSQADRDSLKDPDYVERVVRLAYAVGPHTALLNTLDEVATLSGGSVDIILDLFEQARLVEMFSLGQVAQERVDAVESLHHLVTDPSTEENQLQTLVESAPWLVHPDWTPLTNNQSLASTRSNFESWYQANHGKEVVTSAIDRPTKRPDFVMLNHEGRLEVIEIKRPQHSMSDEEFDRAFGYLEAVDTFISANETVKRMYPEARLTIVCDQFGLDDIRGRLVETDPRISRRTWHDLLEITKRSHGDFLAAVTSLQGELPPADDHDDHPDSAKL